MSQAMALTTTATVPSGSGGWVRISSHVKIQTLFGITGGVWNAPGIDPEQVLSILTTTQIRDLFYLTGAETARLLGPVVGSVEWSRGQSVLLMTAHMGTVTTLLLFFQSYKD